MTTGPERERSQSEGGTRSGQRGRRAISRVGRSAVLGAWLAAVCVHAAEPERREPPLVLYFEADGRRIPVELDQPFAAQALGGAKSATLRLEPHREFAYAGLRFRFPRQFTFAADLESPLVTLWTLSGNDCSIMVHRYRGEPDPKAVQQRVLEQMSETYQQEKKKTRPVSLALEGATLQGTRLEVDLATVRILQDFYAVRSGKDVLVLILQDAPRENGQPSVERLGIEKLLKESLKLPKG